MLIFFGRRVNKTDVTEPSEEDLNNNEYTEEFME